MIKVRILDQCEFCGGEVSMLEARSLTAINTLILVNGITGCDDAKTHRSRHVWGTRSFVSLQQDQ
jgi:hypothetical protein